MQLNFRPKTKAVLRMVGSVLLALVICALLYYFMLPPLNVYSKSFWWFLFLVLAVFAVCLGVFNLDRLGSLGSRGKLSRTRRPDGHGGASAGADASASSFVRGGRFSRIFVWIIPVPLVVLLLGLLLSSPLFHAKAYAGVVTVEDRDFAADMPETTQVTNIALMDSDSARILGNRMLGALADVVSQYVPGADYTQINYQGKPMKIANLEYDGFFKWFNNRGHGIPGYIMVDPIANTAEYHELPEGMRYVGSGYFGEDLTRALRFRYPTKIFGRMSFEVNEQGEVFYIVACSSPRVGMFGAMDVNEVIIFNPVDGSSQLYPVSETPSWVDIVFDGDLACQKYNWHGTLSGGFFNSIIGNKGCTQTTADYGYVVLGDDVWYFTGVTSVTSDESNIGFLLTCARTGEYRFYPVIGADENSAMGAAEGEVQEKGYQASFPSLVNIAGEPTYIMVLKDANGLVKLYALVNVQQYSMVATGETQSAAIAAYTALLAQNGVATVPPASDGEEAAFTATDIRYLTLSGVTQVYLTADTGEVYRIEFNAANEGIVFAKPGDAFRVTYTTEDSGVRVVSAWEITEAEAGT